MAGLSPFLNGPFLNVKLRGLVWIGVPEQCDRCKAICPMAWVTFDGTYFFCEQCYWDVHVEKRSMEYNVKEDLNLIEVCFDCYKYFSFDKLTISNNDLICQGCYRKRCKKQEADVQRLELEKEKLLPPEEREKREMERVKTYYDRMYS